MVLPFPAAGGDKPMNVIKTKAVYGDIMPI
jgi:hypothetical protein